MGREEINKRKYVRIWGRKKVTTKGYYYLCLELGIYGQERESEQ